MVETSEGFPFFFKFVLRALIGGTEIQRNI